MQYLENPSCGIFSLPYIKLCLESKPKHACKYKSFKISETHIVPPKVVNPGDNNNDASTETRSNITKRDQVRKSVTNNRVSKLVFARSGSEMDEVES